MKILLQYLYFNVMVIEQKIKITEIFLEHFYKGNLKVCCKITMILNIIILSLYLKLMSVEFEIKHYGLTETSNTNNIQSNIYKNKEHLLLQYVTDIPLL